MGIVDTILQPVFKLLDFMPRSLKLIIFLAFIVLIGNMVSTLIIDNQYKCVDGEVYDYSNIKPVLDIADAVNYTEPANFVGVLWKIFNLGRKLAETVNPSWSSENYTFEYTTLSGETINATFDMTVNKTYLIKKYGHPINHEKELISYSCNDVDKVQMTVLHLPIFDRTLWILLLMVIYLLPFILKWWQFGK